MKIRTTWILIMFGVVVILSPSPLWAAEEKDATELAKKLQNPVSDLISVPFQSNFNFGYGPDRTGLSVSRSPCCSPNRGRQGAKA